MVIKTFFNFLLLCIFLQLASSEFLNDVCGPLTHCNATAGLICEPATGRCACSNGPFNEQHSYDLEWNSVEKLCVGKLNSVCVGARGSTIAEGMKKVECAEDLSCIQIPGAPLGLGLCRGVPKIFYHGVDCSHSKYCDSSKGLVCSNNTCVCSAERINTSPKYILTWDEEQSNCVGAIDSGCIGTKDSPVENGQKMVQCVEGAECIQVNGQTPGVGVCQRAAGNAAERLHSGIVTFGLFVVATCIKSVLMY